MKIEIHRPEVGQRFLQQIQSGHFRDADERISNAPGARENTKLPDSPEVAAFRKKSFVELRNPVRGLSEDIDFSGHPSTGRPLDL